MEVWLDVEAGRPLLTAYMQYENASLKAQIDADIRDSVNRQRSTGSRSTAGAARERGEMEYDWYSDN